ncbi:Lrp/AsnC family transcriptional regulator [Candidatus Micrarchaeota archaeon]|nr:Lrp/AsnC family transcriptional regulator [Candidatus Micrarchaeota archaeon]MBU2476910.1 Lrp/AsnC family transcriptional regulator [Candidatus Micrarchaeota archaeon]
MTEKIDETDKKILNYMIKTNETRHSKIAKKLKVTPTTIHKRIRKLKKIKALNGLQPLIDLKKIGFDVTVIINAMASKGQLEEAAQKWAKEKNVCSVYRVTGKYDVVVIAKFKNTEELNEFNKRMVKDELIERTNTSIVFQTTKESPNPEELY